MLNGIQFQTVGATWLKALLAKLLAKGRKFGGNFESGCGSRKIGKSDVDLGMGLVKVYCLMCDKGNFEIYTGINREPVEVNEERNFEHIVACLGRLCWSSEAANYNSQA